MRHQGRIASTNRARPTKISQKCALIAQRASLDEENKDQPNGIRRQNADAAYYSRHLGQTVVGWPRPSGLRIRVTAMVGFEAWLDACKMLFTAVTFARAWLMTPVICIATNRITPILTRSPKQRDKTSTHTKAQ